MAYGLEIKSEVDNSMIISEKSPAMLFVGKGTNSTPVTPMSLGHGNIAAPSIYQYNSTISVPAGYTPMVFIATPTGVKAHVWNPVLTTGTTWSVLIHLDSSVAADVYWFINPTALTPSTELYGLRIWSSTGVLIFDSGWGQPGCITEIVDLANLADGSPTTSYTEATITDITKPAFGHHNPYILMFLTAIQPWYIYYRMLSRINTTTIRLTTDILYANTPSGGPGINDGGGGGGTYNIPIIDGAYYD